MRVRSLVILTLLALAGCGTPDPADLEPVDDPRAFVHERVVADATPWWASGRPDYNLTDPVFIDSLIERELFQHRMQLEGELPTIRGDLARFARGVTGRYSTAMTSTASRRAEVEARIRDRFLAPTFEVEDGTVTAEFGIAPSRFENDRADSWRLAYPEAGELTHEHVATAFGLVHAAHPEAKRYRLDVIVPDYSSLTRTTYSFSVDEDRLRISRPNREEYLSWKPVGGIDNLVAGRAPTQTEDLEKLCVGEGCE